MTFRGVIRNGQVQTEQSIELPEGTPVNIEPVQRGRSKRGSSAKSGKDPAFRIGDNAVAMGVADLAAEHKHYLYGTPKRGAAKRAAKTKPGRSAKGRR